MFSLNNVHWDRLFQGGWFPFISIPNRIMRPMISAVKSGSSPDLYTKHIVEALRKIVPDIKARWGGVAILQDHVPLLDRALDRFVEGDYLSATAILFQRIEGILRSILIASGIATKPGQSQLAEIAVRGSVDKMHEYSWLLPNRFKEYLKTVYFANFSAGHASPSLSRNSVAHGVARAQDFNEKGACIGILIVDQLRFLLAVEQSPYSQAYRVRNVHG